MEVKKRVVNVKDFLTKSNLPAADYVINPYIGCPHGCKYCYACFMKRFTGHKEEWGSFIDIKQCSKPISKRTLTKKTVFLSSVTDCYNKFEEEYHVTRSILEQLADIDCKVSISTKSSLIVRDVDLLKRFDDLTAALSVNTLDENFRKDMDNASPISDRLEALKILHENGIQTVLFMSPIFPGLTDFRRIIEVSSPFVDEYWFENLNLRGSYKNSILEYVYNNYPQYKDLYDRIYKKGECRYWSELENEIKAYCAERSVRYACFFYHEKLVKDGKNIKRDISVKS